MRHPRLSSLSALLLIATIGCGKSDNVPVYPVKGVVTFNGKPMQGGGAIAFIPTTSQKGKAAGGEIKKDGTFVMSTYGTGDGSMAGTFRVIITQSVYEEPENTGDSDEAPKAAKPKEPIAEVDKADRIPMIYSDGTNSPAQVTIEAKPNELEIKLENVAAQRGA